MLTSKKAISFFVILFSSLVLSAQKEILKYPLAYKDNTEDSYFGTIVKDPYRWLENSNLERTKEWLKEEEELTSKYLRQILSQTKFDIEFRKNLCYSFGTISKSGPYYCDREGQILYIKPSVDDVQEKALNAEEFGEFAYLREYSISPDGRYLAFCISRSGSDLQEIRIKKLYPHRNLPEILMNVKFSDICWKGNGFYYRRFKAGETGKELVEKNVESRVYYHRTGTPQESDSLIYNPASGTRLNYAITGMGRYLIIYTDTLVKGKLYKQILIQDFNNPSQKGLVNFKIYPNDGSFFTIIGIYKNMFLVQTNLKTPNGKLILMDTKPPFAAGNFIPAYKEILQSASIIGNKVIGVYMKDLDYHALVFDYNAGVKDVISFPVGSSIGGFEGNETDTTTLYYQHSFLHPPVAYEYNVKKLKTRLVGATTIRYDPNSFEIKKIFYPSADSTPIPMFIAARKDLKINKLTPAILYGYGGFGINMTPFFDPGFITHMQNNGLIALPCLRGGAELGEEWHNSGRLLNKQNTFDDFIAAADYMVAKGYTSRERLAIMGASNGGLLVGAVINKRPDLCKVAIARAGVYDMLRYHNFTIGHFVEKEYGTSRDSLEFKYLLKYSPLHNIKESAHYPATLIVAADHDDRVVPLHSYKLTAALQEKKRGDDPVILLVEKNAGHGVQDVNVESMIYAFMYKHLGVKMKSQDPIRLPSQNPYSY